jgi:hypothetical protein
VEAGDISVIARDLSGLHYAKPCRANIVGFLKVFTKLNNIWAEIVANDWEFCFNWVRLKQ